MPSLSNARANSLDFTHVWISEPVVMEIFTKGPRTPHTTMTHEPVYPVTQLFVRFMLQGKVNPAIRLLENCSGSQGVLPLTKSTIDTLKDKHPRAAPAHIGSLLYGPIDEVPDTYFNSIDGDQIGKAIKLTKGAAGPSNMSGAFLIRSVTRDLLLRAKSSVNKLQSWPESWRLSM